MAFSSKNKILQKQNILCIFLLSGTTLEKKMKKNAPTRFTSMHGDAFGVE
jgi:hypothetical protein